MKKYMVRVVGSVFSGAHTYVNIEVPDDVTEGKIEQFFREHAKGGTDVPTDWYDVEECMYHPDSVQVDGIDDIEECDQGDDTDMKLVLDDEGQLVEAAAGSGVDHE